MANKESTFGNAISLRQYLNEQLGSDNGYSDFMKITNINNIFSVPCEVSGASAANAVETSEKFGLGDYIHDAQLVWVGDRFYLQGKKVYEDSNDNNIEKFSPTYLFPFDAIAVTFENKESDGTVHYDLNVPEEYKQAFANTSLAKMQDNISVDTAYIEPTVNNAPEDYELKGWYFIKNPTIGTDNEIDFENGQKNKKIEGHTLYAYWEPEEEEENTPNE